MTTHPILHAETRTKLGKKVRSLRREGILPATVYGNHIEPQSIQVKGHELATVLRRAGRTQVIDLVIGSQTALPVLIKQTEVDAKRNQIIHVEFYQANMRQKLSTQSALHFVGESPAVKDGGIFLPVLDHVQIESLPDDVPAHGIEVDISALAEINALLHVSDVVAPPGVTILTPGDEVVAKVNPLVSEEAVEQSIADTIPLPAELGGDETPPDAVPEA